MHVLHYVVVRAENAEEAGNAVTEALRNFGDEDNYHQLGGSVCEDGTVHVEKGSTARFIPEEGVDTIEKLNKVCQSHVRNPYKIDTKDYKEDFLAWCNRLAKGKRLKNSSNYRVMATIVNQLETDDGVPNPFNILEHSFNYGCYDDFGVTNLTVEGPWDTESQYFNGEESDAECYAHYKRFVVFVDMHT